MKRNIIKITLTIILTVAAYKYEDIAEKGL